MEGIFFAYYFLFIPDRMTFKFKNIIKCFKKLLIFFLGITFFWVLIYRFVNPPITYLMLAKAVERKWNGKSWKLEKEWRNFDKISMNLKKAVIAAEDARFLNHNGFDFEAIEYAFEKNRQGKRIRGGSTITQQTAKNVFLWPGRSYVRKAFEAYFTVLIELLWSKERILEVYLNVIEMGDGIYGAEAATQTYYRKSCESLSKREAALLAAVLPNPIKWSPANPTAYINRRQAVIRKNMTLLGEFEF